MYIYKITNNITKKVYIGQTTKTVSNRISQHKKESNYKSTYLANSIRKYGWSVFSVDILCECASKEELDRMECYYISLYKGTTGVYNLTKGGATGTYGKQRLDMNGDKNPAKSPEARKKISDAKKGCKRPDLVERNKSRQGKTIDDLYGSDRANEIKDKQSKSHTGKKRGPRTEEHTDKIVLANQKITYEMVSPDGDVIIHKNMAKFARDYGLNASSLIQMVKGKRKSGTHKGWSGRVLC